MYTALEEFLTYMTEVKKLSLNTITSYKNDLTRLIRHLEQLSIKDIDRINETCLNSYVLTMEREGKSPATVSRNIAAIKSFTLYLIKQGKLKGDPTERMKPPKVEKKPMQVLSIEQINNLLSQPDTKNNKGIRDKAMLELLYATGLRVSELVSLRLANVNLKNKYIICCNGSKERIVPISNTAKQALEEYILNVRNKIVGEQESPYCFTNLSGEVMTRQGFWKILKAYGKSADIDSQLTPQILRNTIAVHLMENGADIYSVQELLGHTDVSTTQGYLQPRSKKLLEVYNTSHPRL